MRPLLCAVLLLTAAPAARAGDKAKPNTLTPKEIADGWLLLFDGKTPFGWKVQGEAKIQGDTLILGGTKETVVATTSRFALFELDFHYLAEVPPPGGPGPAFRLDIGPRRSFGTTFFRGRWGELRSSIKFDPETRRRTGRHVEGPLAKQGGGLGSGGFDDRDEPVPTSVQFTVPAGAQLSLRNIKLKPLGLKSIFNGKDLTGWKVFPGRKSRFTVTDKGELHVKDGPGDLQAEGKWKDFVLQLECRTNGKHLNSGVFFRCRAGEYQNGYEAQIRNQFTAEPKQRYKIEECDPKTHTIVVKEIRSPAVDYGTGAIYRRMPARLQASKDNEWFTMTVVAQGKHLATWVNGIQVVDWDDCRPLSDNARKGCCLNAGHISLQGHDPTTDLNFRNFRIIELPGAPAK
jgi:hypothetical protein